jgi:hypothetical protein
MQTAKQSENILMSNTSEPAEQNARVNANPYEVEDIVQAIKQAEEKKSGLAS